MTHIQRNPTLPKEQHVKCLRCGHDRSEHFAVNLADGPLVGLFHLICPTTGFLSKRMKEWQAGIKDYADAQPSD